ncbi:MAG TPA: ABC transporter ATP-binding protein [Planctomycetes bacterium]|nr:ABC transporter ATP-binding protein [Planctomycetota bacterium]HIK59130.1 ABC transporter ATP-binding protein [Planctomycetota bacterium]
MVVLIESRGLGHIYSGGVEALIDLDLSIAPGEVVCILGPNGAGKSTLLKALAGLLPITAGEVTWRGESMTGWVPRFRARRLAFVPQSLITLPEVTVRTFVAQGRYSHQGVFARATPEDRQAVDQALSQADLVDLAERALPDLSGGQRQRCLVARALAQQADLLLIDEPTNALDPEHQIAVFELIESLAHEERAVAVVTHDLNLASQFASRIVLLDGGRKVADGTVNEVLRRSVLEPVYGSGLRYSSWRVEEGAEGQADERPIVLPWRSPDPSALPASGGDGGA